MEATSAAAPSLSSPLSEMQSNQMPVSITQEQNLFEYLIDVEKGLGISGEFANPAALFSKVLDHADEISQQVQDVVKSISTRSGDASGAVQAQKAGTTSDPGLEEIDMGQIVEQFWSATWTVYRATAVTNSVVAATSSAQSLIHQS
ncbi:hypothetical protein [Chelativorans salis]|uniref:Uncharacterized protein n=1 Tax=Chelativorans salis TaxID=2978478 RepID=A0ABT2LQK9_9HYPH|nr:hypothetical protein [Chelativorans sp. EGI FJ00035]MCT7376838.1 hypothetical protein [Chelativorans sp. EGI FJ00035]